MQKLSRDRLNLYSDDNNDNLNNHINVHHGINDQSKSIQTVYVNIFVHLNISTIWMDVVEDIQSKYIVVIGCEQTD